MKKDIIQEIYAEFDANNKAQWEEQAIKDLKGEPLENIDWQLNSVITQAAYYTEEDLSKLNTSFLKNYNPDWQIGQDYYVDNYKASNLEILADLNHGLNAPRFHFKNTPNSADFEALFKDIDVAHIFCHFNTNKQEVFNAWQNLLKQRNISSAPAYFESEQIVLKNTEKSLHIDATQFYNGTANIHKEIKQAIDAAKIILEKTSDQTNTAQQLFFTFYVDKSYLANVAKLRAFKLLWLDLMTSNKLELKLPFLRVEFAPDTYKQDEYDNLINATSMAMSAVLGGANYLIVLPSNETKQAKRLARNVQLILKHESGLHKIADPAQGSYYIENLTGKLVGFYKE